MSSGLPDGSHMRYGLDLLSEQAAEHAKPGRFDDYGLDQSEILHAQKVADQIKAQMQGEAVSLHIYRPRIGLNYVTLAFHQPDEKARMLMERLRPLALAELDGQSAGDALRFRGLADLSQAISRLSAAPPGTPPLASAALPRLSPQARQEMHQLVDELSRRNEPPNRR